MAIVSKRPRWLALVFALLAVAFLASGCSVLQPPSPATTQGSEIKTLYEIVFVVAVVIFVIVEGLILWAVVRYRRRDDELPPQIHGHNVLEVIWTAIPMVIVAALFFVSWQTLNTVDARSASPALKIEAVGFQWQWQFNYPEAGVTVIGLPDAPPRWWSPSARPSSSR